jgi:ABC-type transport system substrate-binding protein
MDGNGWLEGSISFHDRRIAPTMTLFTVRIKASALSLDLSPFRFKAGDWEIGRAVFAPLLRLTPDFALQPHLLAAWAVEDDGRAVTFRLRPDLVFHNGRQVEAADLAYSLERGRSPGARASFRQLLAEVSRIDVLDPLTVRVALRRPNRMFPVYFTRAALSLVPREELRPDDPWQWRELPIGCGPYRVEGRDNDRLSLVRHSPFFGLTPDSPDRLVFVLDPTSGGYDIAFDEDVRTEPDFAFVSSSFWSAVAVEHYSFAGQDENRARAMRKLVNSAISGSRLLEALPASTQSLYRPAASFVPPALGAEAMVPLGEQSLCSAEAGYREAWGSLPRLFNVIYRGYGPESDLTVLQRALGMQLRGLGLPVEDLVVDSLDLGPSRSATAFVLAASSFNYPDFDNLSLYFARCSEIHGAPTTGLGRLRALLDRGRETFDTCRQKEIYLEIQALMHEEGWIHPVAHLPEYAFVRRTKISTCSIYGNGPHPFYEDMRASAL